MACFGLMIVVSFYVDSNAWPNRGAVGKEEATKLVDNIYRKMQVSGTDLASKEQRILDSSNAKFKGELVDSFHCDAKVRCPCGSTLETVNSICSFWITIAAKLVTTNIPTDGANLVQSVEKSFHLTRADKDLLSKRDTDVQIIPCTKDGINKISFSGSDDRVFCLGVRIVKRRTLQQVLGSIPKESDGERFEDALARVCRCVGGGAPTDDADSDSDLEVVADSISVNLRCPMSGSRMKVAGRFISCIHMGCFDLDVFVEMNQRSRKARNVYGFVFPKCSYFSYDFCAKWRMNSMQWQCPICLKNYSLENVIIDPFFNRITTKVLRLFSIILVVPNAIGQNPHADGIPCVPNCEIQTWAETEKQIKQEGISEGQGANGFKLGIKNHSGYWQVSKPEDMNASSSDDCSQKVETVDQKVIPVISSASASGCEGEDQSVNQDGGGNLDFTNSGMELDLLARNIDPTYRFGEQTISAAVVDAEIIVLSDTNDDNDILVSSGTGFNNNRNDDEAGFLVPRSGIPEPYHENPNLGAVGNSCWNNDEFAIPIWPL
ncbi:E3 SUMO-protein ligase SIZ1 [Linum perenne]